MKFFRPAVIVGTLPVTLQNGTTADATQVMSDLNWIVNQVNANAAPLANTALTNANNNFTVVQSGISASAAANFPIASQVQNQSFNTLSSTLGTNSITGRIASLPLAAYSVGQVFRFTPAQTNTGPANLTVDSAGSSIIFSQGLTLAGGELSAGVPTELLHDGSKLNILGPAIAATKTQQIAGASTTVFTTPARQQFHPSAAKGWALCDTAASAQTSYNVTSITDGGTGRKTFNWTTGFTNTSYVPIAQQIFTPTGAAAGTLIPHVNNSLATGSTAVTIVNASTFLATDPNFFTIVAFGTQ